jgi:hypothetical protein
VEPGVPVFFLITLLFCCYYILLLTFLNRYLGLLPMPFLLLTMEVEDHWRLEAMEAGLCSFSWRVLEVFSSGYPCLPAFSACSISVSVAMPTFSSVQVPALQHPVGFHSVCYLGLWEAEVFSDFL